MTLIEVMIAMTVFTIAGGAVMTSYIFGLRSFQALSNYAMLDQKNRQVMDKFCSEARKAQKVSGYDDSGAVRSLTLQYVGSKTVNYTFNNYSKTLSRTENGQSTQVLLTNCSLVEFKLGQRGVAINGTPYVRTYDKRNAMLVDLTWKTSRSLPGGVQNTESIQTAQVLIRSQGIIN